MVLFNLFPILFIQEETHLQTSYEAFEMDNQKYRRRNEETYKRSVERHFWEPEEIFRSAEEMGVGSVVIRGD